MFGFNGFMVEKENDQIFRFKSHLKEQEKTILSNYSGKELNIAA